MSAHPASLIARAKLVELGKALLHMNEVHAQQLQLEKNHHGLYSQDVHVESLATNLQGIYTQSEALLKSILQEIDAYVPTSESWHRDLLMQAAAAHETRAAILSEETYGGLGELLSFRHAVRNNYATRLRPADVFRNVTVAQIVIPTFEVEVDSFLREFDDGVQGHKPPKPQE